MATKWCEIKKRKEQGIKRGAKARCDEKAGSERKEEEREREKGENRGKRKGWFGEERKSEQTRQLEGIAEWPRLPVPS